MPTEEQLSPLSPPSSLSFTTTAPQEMSGRQSFGLGRMGSQTIAMQPGHRIEGASSPGDFFDYLRMPDQVISEPIAVMGSETIAIQRTGSETIAMQSGRRRDGAASAGVP